MRASRRDIVIASACLGLGLLLSAVFFGALGGRWQASGDGRTIYNTRTGELRYTHSGESVQEASERRKVERERAEAERKKGVSIEYFTFPDEVETEAKKTAQEREGLKSWEKFDRVVTPSELLESNKTQLIADINKTRQTIATEGVSGLKKRFLEKLWCDAVDMQGQGLVSEELASEAGRWVHLKKERNKEVFKQLKYIVDKHDSVSSSAFTDLRWEPATRPLRISDSLTPSEKDRLLEALGTAVTKVEEQNKADFEKAIILLKEYEERTYDIIPSSPSSWEEYKESLRDSSH